MIEIAVKIKSLNQLDDEVLKKIDEIRKENPNVIQKLNTEIDLTDLNQLVLQRQINKMEVEQMHPIMKLKEDIDKRIQEECEEIKKAENPRKEVEVYAKNIQWYSLELAAYVRKQMLFILNLNN